MADQNRKKLIIASVILIAVVIVVGISYAWLSITLTGQKTNVIKVGNLDLVLDESSSNGITITNGMAITDQEGLATDGSTFSLINNGDAYICYELYLDDMNLESGETRVADKFIKFSLGKGTTAGTPKVLTSIGSNPNRLLDSGTISSGETIDYNLRMWFNSEEDGNYSGQVFRGKLRVEATQCVAPKPAAETLLAKANPEDLDYNSASSEQQKEMWTFSHPATEQTEALTDYRYIGADPNNYVSFNDELWRIIGVFTVDDGTGNKETRLKLIRNESIGNYSWDNKDTTTGAESDNGKNNWADARLNYLLNSGHESESVGGSLYWNSSSGNCSKSHTDPIVACDFTTTGLKEKAKNMIGDTLWYLGSINNYYSAVVTDWYSDERGTDVYSGRSTAWIGKVGLMYPSDYGYATSGGVTTNRNACLNTVLADWDSSRVSDCKNNDWLLYFDQWTLTHNKGMSSYVYYVASTFYGHPENSIAYTYRNVRPVVFLKSNITIASGNGSSSQPYILQS